MPYRSAAIFSCLFLLACAQADNVKRLENLDILEWTHRIILISVDAEQKPDILQRLERDNADIDERHIAWFLLSDADILSNLDADLSPVLDQVIRKEYFRNTKTGVVLIGKDGGVKYRDNALDLDEIYGRIDLMPMRRAEMAESNQ
ncbi:MAG: DUF4174 domain-containing protein [Chromatiales bacterium]|jgi:hypothetical protein